MRTALWLLILFVLPLLISAGLVVSARAEHWSRARWDTTGLAPAADTHQEAVIQVYAARTWGWKGAFAVHSWLAYKPEGAAATSAGRWGSAGECARACRRSAATSGRRTGAGRAAIPCCWSICAVRRPRPPSKIQDAIARYPYRDAYVTWPGPSSSTFVAWIGREVPELGLTALPPTAIGKDFLGRQLAATTPSGTGLQISLGGLLGVAVGLKEVSRLNLLGLVVGVDPLGLAIKLPRLGRLGAS
ncbi:MAG: DUF3750 domain-containing protein [Geminicoccaceae bacterium]